MTKLLEWCKQSEEYGESFHALEKACRAAADTASVPDDEDDPFETDLGEK